MIGRALTALQMASLRDRLSKPGAVLRLRRDSLLRGYAWRGCFAPRLFAPMPEMAVKAMAVKFSLSSG